MTTRKPFDRPSHSSAQRPSGALAGELSALESMIEEAERHNGEVREKEERKSPKKLNLLDPSSL